MKTIKEEVSKYERKKVLENNYQRKDFLPIKKIIFSTKGKRILKNSEKNFLAFPE